jgi:hypothetical protein
LKFLDNIKSRLIQQVAGLTIHYSSDGDISISFIVLKNVNGKIKIVFKKENINDPDKISEFLEKGIPVWLTITGRPVIIRKLETDPGENYLHYILPNAREEDFVVSVVKIKNDVVFVSAIRNDHILQLVSKFHLQNINILGYSIGPASINALYQYGLLNNNEILLPGYHIKTNEGIISSVSVEPICEIESYQVGDEYLKANLILPFTSAPTDEENFIYSKLNKILSVVLVSFVFLILLINFFVFSHFNTRTQELSSELAYQDSFFQKYDSLHKELDQKAGLIKKMGLTQNTKFGYYADCIAASVPSSITLNQLIVNPIEGNIKPDESLSFKILI